MKKKIIIFIKNPVYGKVKTRISVGSDDNEALKIYKLLLEKTRSITNSIKVEKHLFYSDFIDANDIWNNDLYYKHKQAEGDLGEKMHEAFKTCLTDQEEESKVLIIGSDCPYIDNKIISGAFRFLDNFDIVIGPTFDGGYYLLGMKQLYSDLFFNIPWSSESVFLETIQKVKKLGLTFKEIKTLNDIDTYQDWQIYVQNKR